MDIALISALSVLFALILGVIYLRPGLRTVPQEERLVIYRMGHFDRIAGPGLVFLLHRIDTVQRSFMVREQPLLYRVDNLFIYGVPVALTLSIWAAFDPVRAVGNDFGEQMRLIVFSEHERSTQVILALRNILVQELGAIEQAHPLPAQATMGDKILPIIPGLPICSSMLERVRTRLRGDMRTIGFVLNQTQPIQITGIQPPESVSKGFDRERAMSFLRVQFPNLSDDSLMQLYATIEKLDLPNLQRLLVQNESNMSTRIEQRTENAQGGQTRVSMQTPAADAPVAAAAQPAINSPAVASQKAPAPDSLMPADLTVLKRVPRTAPDQRKAA